MMALEVDGDALGEAPDAMSSQRMGAAYDDEEDGGKNLLPYVLLAYAGAVLACLALDLACDYRRRRRGRRRDGRSSERSEPSAGCAEKEGDRVDEGRSETSGSNDDEGETDCNNEGEADSTVINFDFKISFWLKKLEIE